MTEKEPTINLTLRVPISLKLRIEMEAHKDARTVNSYINKLLKEYYEIKK